MTLDRRRFTAGSIATAAAAITLPRAFALPRRPVVQSDVPLHTGWDVLVEGRVIERDATLPHTPALLSWHKWDPTTWEKVWTYRRTLPVASTAPDVRHFLHVDRALANATVTVNGKQVAEHQGGFLPFACEITDAVHSGNNDLVIRVDSRWLNVPPSGSSRGVDAVDYYLPGGLNGRVSLQSLPCTFVADVNHEVHGVLNGRPSIDVRVTLDAQQAGGGTLTARLFDNATILHETLQQVILKSGRQDVLLTLPPFAGARLWSPETPNLYRLEVLFHSKRQTGHALSKRIGFREARFEPDGFYLNGNKTRLFGLNRHELFPYVGFAASPRALRHDAAYLRHTLNCNIVRCSHYPQSVEFLDACDEFGLMVWEEIPGWQYIGDTAWKEVAMQNTEDMIKRDRHHPSIIIWGTRVNESPNDPDLYQRTRAIAKHLDPSRPTSGSMTPSSRKDWQQRWHEDVFAFDDYHAAPDGTVGIDRALPGVPYMNAEAVGQFSYGTAKNFLRRYRRAGIPEEQNAQAVLHAQAHDRAAQDPRNAGVIAWCAFDYASPMNAYDGVKCPGVVDTFRIAKLGASFYKSQIHPSTRVVIEPGFYWDTDLHASTGRAAIFSNCDQLRIYLDDTLVQTARPDRSNYPMLAYAPFFCDLPWDRAKRSTLRMDGVVNGTVRLSRSFQGTHDDDRLWLERDDAAIEADGIDTTRISFGVADRFGNTRPSTTGSIAIEHSGAGKMLGGTSFALSDSGAVGAVWLRSLANQSGIARITVTHPDFESRSISVNIQRNVVDQARNVSRK